MNRAASSLGSFRRQGLATFASRSLKRLLLLVPVVCGGLQPQSLRACVACYGQSDSPLAEGMNWAILSLLVIIGLVLSGVAAFFVYLAKRSANLRAADTALIDNTAS